MGYAGKIFPSLTHIEIDEDGNIWQTFNNVGNTIIEELDAVAHGRVTVEVVVEYPDYDEEEDLY